MRILAFLREILQLGGLYILGVAAGLGWMAYGYYVYFLPVTNPKLGTDFNYDVGTSLVTTGVVFLITFVVGFVINLLKGSRERDEARKDREMLREIHQWMQELRSAEATTKLSSLPASNGNGAKAEREVSNVN